MASVGREGVSGWQERGEGVPKRRVLALKTNAKGKDEELEFSKAIGTDIFIEIAPCFGEC